MAMMHPYWIMIERLPEPNPLNLGAGITAHSEADALELFALAFGSSYKVVSVEPINDVNDLDQGHVMPNMGNWLRRGVWYPLGFEDISSY